MSASLVGSEMCIRDSSRRLRTPSRSDLEPCLLEPESRDVEECVGWAGGTRQVDGHMRKSPLRPPSTRVSMSHRPGVQPT
eukprot:14702931-Alexandrium_andersonii.AAC.1